MKNYFVIAGEASGDLHAARLMEQIQRLEPDARFCGLGGDRMKQAGCVLFQHIRHMAFMGFAAVLSNAGQVRRNFRITREALLSEKPDVLILIDYPSFNLQIARFCRRHLPDTKIIYYIPPKVWAWKRRRIHSIAKLCDRVLGIFPFEPAFYARYGYACTYVGHPTTEQVQSFQSTHPTPSKRGIVILPGSRPSEITHCLPRMLQAARRFPDYPVTVCAAPSIDDAMYTPFLHEGETLTRDTYSAVQHAQAAIVNSGTATLEVALLGCPQVSVYYAALSSLIYINRWWLFPLLFSIPYFTPVNIVVGKEVIKEYMTYNFTVDNVAAELDRLLHDTAHQKEVLDGYQHLSSLLGSHSASSNAAHIITSLQ